MHIYPKRTGPITPETSKPTQPADLTDRGTVRPTPPTSAAVERSDKVQISDAGRALAAHEGGSAESVPLDAERAARIRDRILSGAYDTLEVVDAVARRLLDSGDL